MKYRQIFHYTPQEVEKIPVETIFTDLEMINIEGKMKNAHMNRLMKKAKAK